MIVRLVCVLASSSCIGTELAADVAENVESENTDFRAVLPAHRRCSHPGCVLCCSSLLSAHLPPPQAEGVRCAGLPVAAVAPHVLAFAVGAGVGAPGSDDEGGSGRPRW